MPPEPSGLRRLFDGPQLIAGGAIALLVLAAIAASVMAAPGLQGYLGAGLALIALAIAVVDARRFIIPNELSAAGFLLGLVNAAVMMPEAMAEAASTAALRGAVLALAFLGLRALFRRVRGHEGLGLGDVKLACVAGAWLGWLTIPIAVEMAAVAALAVYGVRYYVGGKPHSATLKFPFGAFLAPSIWICWLLEATVLNLV